MWLWAAPPKCSNIHPFSKIKTHWYAPRAVALGVLLNWCGARVKVFDAITCSPDVNVSTCKSSTAAQRWFQRRVEVHTRVTFGVQSGLAWLECICSFSSAHKIGELTTTNFLNDLLPKLQTLMLQQKLTNCTFPIFTPFWIILISLVFDQQNLFWSSSSICLLLTDDILKPFITTFHVLRFNFFSS